MTMPRTSGTERADLYRHLQRHGGNMSAVARSLSKRGRTISRQTVARKVEVLGLEEAAASLGLKNNVPGRRSERVDLSDARDQERDRILNAWARHGSIRAAADMLKMAHRTIYRRIKAYGITDAEVQRRRRLPASSAKRR